MAERVIKPETSPSPAPSPPPKSSPSLPAEPSLREGQADIHPNPPEIPSLAAAEVPVFVSKTQSSPTPFPEASNNTAPAESSPILLNNESSPDPRSTCDSPKNSAQAELSPPSSKKDARSTHKPSHGLATWQVCGALELLKQVEVKDKAVIDGLVCLRDIERNLRQHGAQIPSSKKWLDRIETIRQDKKECRVLIGFLGTTGAGKSSMINAILEHDDLLPADDEKACTAVCVEIRWNPNDDPKFAYLAKIDRISREEWKIELEKLFNDISDHAQNEDGDDGEVDLERDLRMKAAFGKVKCVYPHIKAMKDLVTNSVENLLDHPNVKSILGTSKFFNSGSREGFSTLIKPYIDSSNSKEGGSGKSFAQWPLVKLVSLQIKSPILKDGIVMVDLPGSMDTNAARGAIAEVYQKNLSVTCVVTPTARAASDKPAQDLLGKVQQQTMQLDNRFSSDQLCFVISKIDSSLKVQRYIESHPNVEAELTPEFENEARWKGMLSQGQKFCEQKMDSKAEHEKAFEILTKELKKLTASFKKTTSGRSKCQKRKRVEQEATEPNDLTLEQKALAKKIRELQVKCKETKALSHQDGGALYKAQSGIKKLESLLRMGQSRKMAACIKNRNRVSTTEIRKDYEAAAKQVGQKSGKPLQVFCVSSWAFADMTKGNNTPGFLKQSDTGIPALQTWLVETTLATRDRNAVALLEDVVSLELWMTPWVADSSAEFKMPEDQRMMVEEVFDKNFDILEKHLKHNNSEIVRVCEKMVDSGVFSKMPNAESAATEEAERIVKGWMQKPMHWATHRAVNKAHGDYKTSKGLEHHWNDELASNYLDPLLKQWTGTINTKLPAVRSSYDEEAKRYIRGFTKSVGATILGICSDLGDAVQNWQESSLRTVGPIQRHSLSIFDNTIQEAANEAHRLVKPKVLDAWKAVYTQCGAETGPGHYKRNQAAHTDHIKKVGRAMYRKGSTAIKHAFKKLWEGLSTEFNQGTTAATTQIREEFDQMLNNHTMKFDKETNERIESAAKVQLQQEILVAFDRMKAAWAQEVEVIVIEDEDEPVEEEITLDDLFGPDDDGDDMDFIPGSEDSE